MKTGWWRKTGWCTALAALSVMVSASGTSAQVDDQDCRCVDRDGNAIDNCTCFSMPDVPRMLAFGQGGDFDFPFPGARPRLGVTVSTDQDDGFDGQGARVTDVMDEGPAAEAGIQEGDIITRVDGQSLFEPLPGDDEENFDLDASIPVQRLLAIAGNLDPGESVEVQYLRGDQTRTATVEVEDLAGAWGAFGRTLRAEIMPQMDVLREQLREQSFDLDRTRPNVRVFQDRMRVSPGFGVARYGLDMIELTPGLGTYFGTEQGVLISDIDEDSPLGLRPGDVILRVGDREATSPERVRRILESYGDDESVTFRVRRQGSELDVLGRLGG
jgi:hypothetical protein